MICSSLYPIKVVDIELSQPIPTFEGLVGYLRLQALIRLQGKPITFLDVPIINGCCHANTIGKLILENHSSAIVRHLLINGLATTIDPKNLRLADLLDIRSPLLNRSQADEQNLPLVTVAVCTRDRTSDLALCLNALTQLNYPNLEILVVDNAPSTGETQELVQRYPDLRYVCEPRPGLNWARNRAILEARGEILAYTDDDVIVDANWVSAIAQVFDENAEVMAVTGLVVPAELETAAPALFEQYGGFGRGFERQWYRSPTGKMPWKLLGTGQLGTGANMAYRRCLFEQIEPFDLALDVGTVTHGGGDLEMFFRVLKSGHTLVYEPSAIVRHRHRQTYSQLRTQIQNNGSLYSYFVCAALKYPEEALSFVWLGLWWLCYWHIRRYLLTWIHPTRFPRDLIVAEVQGGWTGLFRYPQARRIAAQIRDTFGEPEPIANPNTQQALTASVRSSQGTSQTRTANAIAIRMFDLTELHPITDIQEYAKTQIFVSFDRHLIGSVEIANFYQPLSISRLLQVITDQLSMQILQAIDQATANDVWNKIMTFLHHRFVQVEANNNPGNQLPENSAVSIVLATCDRPQELRNCLRHLTHQETNRSLEIIVVDNRPTSGLTPPVVAEFPGVMLVKEFRAGVAYARNAGIAVSTGDIIVTTDDDTIMPSNWLETLLTPFGRSDVMAVSGNILPLKLEQASQILFEDYGGLGRGFASLEVDGKWFERSWCHSVPTWELGGTANAAFRASLFSDPAIGLMHEALGPGMPSGVGEDSYLFYKILKAGHTLVYEPSAYVWHQHRQDMTALRQQIYNYSKGHIAHHLTTLIQDGDLRAIARIFVGLPLVHLHRFYLRLRGRSPYPVRLLALEIMGNLAGFWSLWRSHQRVKQQGYSVPYIRADAERR